MTDTTTLDAIQGARDSQQQLQRRREDLVRSRQEAAAGRAEIAQLQARTDALQGTRADTKQRLAEAEQLLERLRKDLKKHDKEREQLTKRLRDARKSLVELDRRVGSREQKYDRAVLADLVEREKVRDLAGSGEGSATATAQPGAPASVARTTEQDKPAEPVSVVEHKADGTTTTTRGGTPQPTSPRVAGTRATTTAAAATRATRTTKPNPRS